MRTFIDHSALITVGLCLNGKVNGLCLNEKAKIEERGKTFLDFAVNIVFSDNIYLSWYENKESVLNDSDWAIDEIQRIIPENIILPVGKPDGVFEQIFVDNCLYTAEELVKTAKPEELIDALKDAHNSEENFVFAPEGYSEDKINALHNFLYDVAKYPSPPADKKTEEIKEELLASKNDLMPVFMILKTPELYGFLHRYIEQSGWDKNRSGLLEHYLRSLVYGRLPGYMSEIGDNETPLHKKYKIDSDLSKTINGIRKDKNIFYWPNATRIRALSHWTYPVIEAIKHFAEEQERAQARWTISLENNGGIARRQMVCELRNAFFDLKDVSPESILKYAVELRQEIAPFRRNILNCNNESCIRDVLKEIFAEKPFRWKSALQRNLSFFTLFNALTSLAGGLDAAMGFVAARGISFVGDGGLEQFKTKKVINAKIGFQKLFDAATCDNGRKFQEFCRKL